MAAPEHAAAPGRTRSMHASCAALGDQGVLLLGAPGSGKSDLLLRLVDRGFMLVADDRVLLEDGRAAAPPVLAGLVEVRGLGLLRMAHVEAVAVALVAMLDAEAGRGTDRLPVPSAHPVLGVPVVRIAPFHVSAALRIELALDCLAGRRSLVAGVLP